MNTMRALYLIRQCLVPPRSVLGAVRGGVLASRARGGEISLDLSFRRVGDCLDPRMSRRRHIYDVDSATAISLHFSTLAMRLAGVRPVV